MEAYIGQVCFFAFPYAIKGWMPCDGRLLPITQYQALFAVIGTYYGGDGRTNFALPDLRGRVLVGTNIPAVADRIPAATVGAHGGAATMTIPPATEIVAVQTTTETGDSVAKVQVPQALTATVPPPPFEALSAFICVDGYFPVRE